MAISTKLPFTDHYVRYSSNDTVYKVRKVVSINTIVRLLLLIAKIVE